MYPDLNQIEQSDDKPPSGLVGIGFAVPSDSADDAKRRAKLRARLLHFRAGGGEAGDSANHLTGTRVEGYARDAAPEPKSLGANDRFAYCLSGRDHRAGFCAGRADVATAKAKPAAAINLIIVFLPFFDLSTGKNTDGQPVRRPRPAGARPRQDRDALPALSIQRTNTTIA